MKEYVIEEDIIGLDANILVDLVESEEFKANLKEQIQSNLRIFTTNIAFGEAKNVLIKNRNYDKDKAHNTLLKTMKEFSINMINHNEESNEIGDRWFNTARKTIYINKFETFSNDCRIIANLVNQAKVNLYFTEDKDIEKIAKMLNLPLKIRLVREASNISGFEVRQFFKEIRKAARKKRKHF